MRSTIIRNNRNFLIKVINPDKIIFRLEACGCLTEDQVTFLTQLRNQKDTNHELLFMLQDFSSQKYSKFIDCLFATNQTPAALVLERGGEAVKLHINNGKETRTKEFERDLIKKLQRMQTENTLILNDILNASVEKRLNDVCILHAKQNKGIELWFWCKTKCSLNQLKGLSEEDHREIIYGMYQRLIPEHSASFEPQLIQMDYVFDSEFAERRLSIRHVGDIDSSFEFVLIYRSECSKNVTSLADKIYLVKKTCVFVYENKFPYQSLKPIEVGDKSSLISIASCNINKCLYVSAPVDRCIYKVEPEFDNRVSQWLNEITAFIISVTSKGDILFFNHDHVDTLRIFTYEGTVRRSISIEHRFSQIEFIQEIMPDIVALNYVYLTVSGIAIMRLDENGTILHNIECQEDILGLYSFRYGDLLIGISTCEYKNADMRSNSSDSYQIAQNFHDFLFPKHDRGIVQLRRSPFDSNAARNLITTEDMLISIHFSADQKQLYVLSRRKLDIYQLNYEDEDCDRLVPSFVNHLEVVREESLKNSYRALIKN